MDEKILKHINLLYQDYLYHKDNKKTLKKLCTLQKKGQLYLCPKCSGSMYTRLALNPLSKCNLVYICKSCSQLEFLQYKIHEDVKNETFENWDIFIKFKQRYIEEKIKEV